MLKYHSGYCHLEQIVWFVNACMTLSQHRGYVQKLSIDNMADKDCLKSGFGTLLHFGLQTYKLLVIFTI